MQKISNSSSTDSELEVLEIEITTDTQNNKTKNIIKDEIIDIIPNKLQTNNQKLPPKLPPKTNNQIPLPQLPPRFIQNNNPQLPPQNMAQIIYSNTEITRINNNIQILDQNNKNVLKKIKSYKEQNDYLITSLVLTIGILSCCNPILLTVGTCIIPKSTSNSQRRIMCWMKIWMVISWILLTIKIISWIIYLIIV